jgi:WD40 repeat protein/serine/threonine protein kinase
VEQARRVDETCDRFEKEWRAGTRPDIEQLIACAAAEERPVLLRELILLDTAYRQRVGEQPLAGDYLERFDDVDAKWLAAIIPPPITLPAAPPGRLPRVVPGFEIIRELGRGGMGVVYLARQVSLNRLVALKTILAGAGATAEERQRLQREAEAIARLQHPNVVQIFQVGEVDGRLFLALEFVNRGNLSGHLAGKPLSARAAAALVETLALAIEHAHSQGIIHRDLKPANILLADARTAGQADEAPASPPSPPHSVSATFASLVPKISDFGLAKLVQDSVGLTGTHDLLGTPSYMAPEQVTGEADAIGPAVDVYGLGAILYELLTGRAPSLADSPWATLLQVRHEEPVAPSRLQPQTPRDLTTICLKCLEKVPRYRYARAGELAADLRLFLDQKPIRARRAGPVERVVKWSRRRPAIAALLAGLIVVTIAGLAGILSQWWRADRERSVALAAREKAEREEGRARRAQAEAETQLHFNRLSLAQYELDAFNARQAAEILALVPPSRREWEWHYLHHQCNRSLLHLTGARWPIRDLAFDADGQYLAAASGEFNGDKPGDVLVWDLRGAPEALHRPTRDGGHTGPVNALAFHPDSKRLASGGRDRTIRLWEWAASREGEPVVQLLHGHASIVTALAFHPSGNPLAAGYTDGLVLLWDVTTGTIRKTLKGHLDMNVFALRFSRDGQYLASGSRDGTACLWKMTNVEESDALHHKFHCPPDVRSLAFDPKGRWLAIGNWGGIVRHFDLSKPDAEPITWQLRSGPVFDIAFSPDGRRVAWCGGQGVVEISDFPSGRTRNPLRGHEGPVNRVAFSPDGRRLATGGAVDRSVRIWDVSAAPEPEVWSRAHSGAIIDMAFSPDGRQLALAGAANYAFRDPGEKSVFLLDLQRRTTRKFHAASPTFYSSVAFHPGGEELAAGAEDNTTTVWNVATGGIRHTLKEHTRHVIDVAYRKDGKWLATASADGTVKLWDSATGKVVRTLTGHSAAVISVAFRPDGTLLASAGADRTIRIWDLHNPSESPQRILRGHAADVTSVAWSPDGRYLASASIDQVLKLWDAATGEETMPPDRPALFGSPVTELAPRDPSRWHFVPRLAFCPRGLRLASVSAKRPVQLWDVPTGTKALSLPLPSYSYLSLAFDPTGRRLVASNGTGLVFWDSGSR